MKVIKAVYDGAEREFQIKREHVQFLEASMGRPLFATLKVITSGNWLFEDILTILSFALLGPTEFNRSAIHGQAKYGMKVPYSSYQPHPAVRAVLIRDGHGNYAELVADLLTQTIFGDKNDG